MYLNHLPRGQELALQGGPQGRIYEGQRGTLPVRAALRRLFRLEGFEGWIELGLRTPWVRLQLPRCYVP